MDAAARITPERSGRGSAMSASPLPLGGSVRLPARGASLFRSPLGLAVACLLVTLSSVVAGAAPAPPLSSRNTLRNRTLNITIVGNGTVARNPDLPDYVDGSNVETTATPDAGNGF